MGKPKRHKRKGPKSTRAGCLMCKPHKHQSVKSTKDGKTAKQLAAEESFRQQLKEL